MTHPLKRLVARSFACLAAVVVLAGAEADAAYFITLNNLVVNGLAAPSGSATVTQGGTSVTLQAVTPQAGFTGPSNANAFNVTNSSTTVAPANDIFSFNFSVDIFLSGTGNAPNTGGSETVRLTGTFNVNNGQAGAILTNVTNGSVALLSGGGFNVAYQGYGAPTPGSVAGSSDGAISISITPTVSPVPEPASVAMVGLGLAGIGMTALRRRRSV